MAQMVCPAGGAPAGSTEGKSEASLEAPPVAGAAGCSPVGRPRGGEQGNEGCHRLLSVSCQHRAVGFKPGLTLADTPLTPVMRSAFQMLNLRLPEIKEGAQDHTARNQLHPLILSALQSVLQMSLWAQEHPSHVGALAKDAGYWASLPYILTP